MPKIRMTARKLGALKPTPGRQIDYIDISLPGFYIRVSPAGRKTFGVMYRHAGRFRRMNLGTYPPLSLADARKMANKALRDATQGMDPAAIKMEKRKAESFAELAHEYLERHAKPKKKEKSWREDERIISTNLGPVFGKMRAREITRKDVRKLLDSIAHRAPIMANRVRALLRKIFNWGIENDIVDANPCHLIAAPGKEQKRQRVLTEEEIRAVWNAFGNESPITAGTLKLRLITAQRGGEVMSLEWSELELENRWWTIPPEKSKNGLAHRVPLSSPALRILEGIKAPEKSSKYVFPSPKGNSHIANIQKAIERSRYRSGVEFRGHDLRRTAASLMTGMGISRLTVAKILNHAERGATATYDRHSYDHEKRQALDAWGTRLSRIVSGLELVKTENGEG